MSEHAGVRVAVDITARRFAAHAIVMGMSAVLSG